VTFVDATDRFRIESALRERNEALEASDKLKSEFVKRVSYELRTPLNSIMGFAQMLTRPEHGTLNKKQGEYADAIVRASEGLRDLINDILDLSTIEAGVMELDLQSLDLYTLLSGVAEHAQEWAGKIGLTLALECAEDAGTFIGDGRRLRQVVFNLLSNAFKFTPRTGRVSPELMPQAFERFSAKGVAVTRAGAGLGLALVNRFVELHHGWVELESQPGQGTRVTCHLPRRAEALRQSAT
jgi:signal transduction histidine kinase